MFNKTTTTTNFNSKVVAVTKEIEKTITPDKVTEIYDKVRDEVEKTIVQKIVVSNNIFSGVAVEIIDEASTMSHYVLTNFILNGVKCFDKHLLGDNYITATKDTIIEKLFEHYKQVVAKELIKESLREVYYKLK